MPYINIQAASSNKKNIILKTTIVILLSALVVVLLCFAGLGIKILLKPRGEFKRHCSSIDPYTGEGGGCVCANAKSAACNKSNKHPYQPLDVNENLMKELQG